jgi:hypothetical protein
MREAVAHEPPPSRDRLAQIAAEGSNQFWIVDGEPAAMAGIVRRTRNAAAIARVYSPLFLRGRGYAGSVTAAVVNLTRHADLVGRVTWRMPPAWLKRSLVPMLRHRRSTG